MDGVADKLKCRDDSFFGGSVWRSPDMVEREGG